MNNFDPMLNISPIDGRYASKVRSLSEVFSEYGLIKRRFAVEVAWLEALCAEPGIPEAPALSQEEIKFLDSLVENFSEADAARVKEIEATTNHDVKAVEYAIKEKLKGTSLESRSEFVHFSCTSEDINNLSHALMLHDGTRILREAQESFVDELAAFANDCAEVPMLARTHGQPASPTTLGKEVAVFVHRLRRIGAQIDAVTQQGKLSGAVGNYNAHFSAYPDVNWPALSKSVIEGRFGLEQNLLTTQIESHDSMAELFDAICRWNTVLLSLDRDFWQYISLGYIGQRPKKGEVGSSTMPHKINPIDFENSEGNLGVANALFEHFARKLPVSRLQRDLTDSTVIRNVGTAFAHSLLAVVSTKKGLGKAIVNAGNLAADLDDNWEVLAEPIQTVMRKAGLENPYERLKELTRGHSMDKETIRAFVESLELPEADKKRLLDMTPSSYIGIAPELARAVINK